MAGTDRPTPTPGLCAVVAVGASPDGEHWADRHAQLGAALLVGAALPASLYARVARPSPALARALVAAALLAQVALGVARLGVPALWFAVAGLLAALLWIARDALKRALLGNNRASIDD